MENIMYEKLEQLRDSLENVSCTHYEKHFEATKKLIDIIISSFKEVSSFKEDSKSN